MTPRMLVPIALFVAGVSLIVVAVATGEAEVSLFLIFPVFSGSSGIFLLGTLLIVFSFIVGLSLMMMGQAGLARGALEPLPTAKEIEAGARTRYGGVVLVGPVAEQRQYHPEGELATVRGAAGARAGSPVSWAKLATSTPGVPNTAWKSRSWTHSGAAAASGAIRVAVVESAPAVELSGSRIEVTEVGECATCRGRSSFSSPRAPRCPPRAPAMWPCSTAGRSS